MTNEEFWLRALDVRAHKRPHLHLVIAQKIAAAGLANAWHVVPFAGGYAAGLAPGANSGCVLVTDNRGDPLTFGSPEEACDFLRNTLHVSPDIAIAVRTLLAAEL